MLKINYFYFKRAKTAQTNTEPMKRSWPEVPKAYSEPPLDENRSDWDKTSKVPALPCQGVERGPGETRGSAQSASHESVMGCLSQEELLPERRRLPTKAGGGREVREGFLGEATHLP